MGASLKAFLGHGNTHFTGTEHVLFEEQQCWIGLDKGKECRERNAEKASTLEASGISTTIPPRNYVEGRRRDMHRLSYQDNAGNALCTVNIITRRRQDEQT